MNLYINKQQPSLDVVLCCYDDASVLMVVYINSFKVIKKIKEVAGNNTKNALFNYLKKM